MNLMRSAIFALSFTAATLAQADPIGITATGTAMRDVEPDRASMTIGVTTERGGAADAANENARAARAIVDTIAAAGIERRDIRTSALTLSPIYSQATGNTPATIRAYRAGNEVAVTIRKIEAAGALVQSLMEKGVTNLSGPSFDVSNAETLTDELRGDAAKDARRKAEIIANALGVRLGRPLDARTTGGPQPMFRAAPAVMRAAAAPPPPIERGTERLSSEVTVTFEIVP